MNKPSLTSGCKQVNASGFIGLLALVFVFIVLQSSAMAQGSSRHRFSGNWSGVVQDGKLTCTLVRTDGTGGISPGNAVFNLQELTPPPAAAIHEYVIRRDAGTLTLTGDLQDKKGAGQFVLVPDEAFITGLSSRLGFSITEPEIKAHLFYTDLDNDYFTGLEKAGYKITSSTQLLNLAVHGEDATGFQTYMSALSAKGYPAISLDQYIQNRIHGVDVNFIDGFGQLGFSHIPMDKMLQLKVMGVSKDYLLEFEKLGLRVTSADQAIELKAHQVTAAYVVEMQKKGYKNLTLAQYRDLKARRK